MAAAKEEAKLLNNTFVMDQNIRFDTFSLEWLETFKRPHVKESTYDRISRTVRNHLIPQFGEYRLIDINRVMYQKWLNEKVEVYSLGTVQSFHSTFSSILDHALLDMNLIEKNSVHRIQISKRNDTLDEDDIDLDAGTVRVNKTLSFGSKLELKVTKPKTKKANRTLRIDAQTNELMRRHRRARKKCILPIPITRSLNCLSCPTVRTGHGFARVLEGIIYEMLARRVVCSISVHTSFVILMRSIC